MVDSNQLFLTFRKITSNACYKFMQFAIGSRKISAVKPSEIVRRQTTALNPSPHPPWAPGSEIKPAVYTDFSKIEDLWSINTKFIDQHPSERKLDVAKPPEIVRWQTRALNPSTGCPWAFTGRSDLNSAAYTVFSKFSDLWTSARSKYRCFVLR